jgi:hypothetical protein
MAYFQWQIHIYILIGFFRLFDLGNGFDRFVVLLFYCIDEKTELQFGTKTIILSILWFLPNCYYPRI